MTHVEIYNIHRERIRISQNLRGILDHARDRRGSAGQHGGWEQWVG